MSRPVVQIETTNQISTLRQHLETMLPHFMTFPGVVGITLNGGMSRGYADHLSEIDVTFYLTPEVYLTWQQGKSPIALGIVVLNGQLYDIKVLDYAQEQAQAWEAVTLWDASYAEILYDPDQLVQALFAEKLAEGVDPAAAEGLMMGCWWYFELAGSIWLHRGDVVQGHHMLNQAVTTLVQALFAANCEYTPHEKWLLHMSRSLEWQPADWETRLNAAMSTGDMTTASLKTRQTVIRGLWEELDEYLKTMYCPTLPVHIMQKGVYEQLKLLAEQGSITLTAWREGTGGNMPNGDPFYPVIRLEGEQLVLDREALLHIGPDEMYAWHYAVLQAVASLG